MGTGCAYTLEQCRAVSKAWRVAVVDRSSCTVSVRSPNVSRLTENSVLHRLISSIAPSQLLRELRLHGLVRITDDALSPLRHASLPRLRLVDLTFCASLTTGVRLHLPSSVRELHVAGCPRMYDSLRELHAYTLDVHVCEHGRRAVEDQARTGFRFVNRALRAGIRLGAACCAGQACAFCPDVLQPTLDTASPHDQCHEVVHASVADWTYAR